MQQLGILLLARKGINLSLPSHSRPQRDLVNKVHVLELHLQSLLIVQIYQRYDRGGEVQLREADLWRGLPLPCDKLSKESRWY